MKIQLAAIAKDETVLAQSAKAHGKLDQEDRGFHYKVWLATAHRGGRELYGDPASAYRTKPEPALCLAVNCLKYSHPTLCPRWLARALHEASERCY